MSGLEGARERGKSAENSKTIIDNMDAPLNVNEAGEMFLQWPCLSCENINVLMELSVDQVQLQLADVLDLKKHQTCVKEGSVLDYFVAGFWWAKEMTFTCQQISFIMSLLQLLLDNIKDKHMPFADNFKEFTRTLLSSRQSSPSASATVNPLFDVDQIKSITDYFSSSLFQHYRLYEFLFTHPRDDMLLGMERYIEVVNPADFVAPLEEGTPTDDLHHIAPSPVAPPDQDSDACAEKDEEESDECEQVETLESREGFSVGDVREVLEEMTREMLGKLQEDFTEKLRIQEETYTARLESLKRLTSK
ncbi:ciliary-associated calcium-binding coiled-coil protein 1 isoform X2 [Ictalurus furcatus]|uniref:ciliary-associated calcium-binding coiled-coil protein 1 isoform X2 n=1 Tax=Ictalurus furcatus TaxID=66913 RepID=UPI002350B911|nr:ciliary-associated calcium-binding coiled-coil protein 1 isoform X2 [Ictalurus furcatus]